MENNEYITNQDEVENDLTPETTESPAVQESESLPSDLGESGNLDICPNCLEPNTEDLAVCKYCGMPLHQGADPESYIAQEDEAAMAASRAEAAPEEKKPQKKQESGFRRVMPWLGLYLIYYAITGCIDINRQLKQAAEAGETVNAPLAYGAQVIWFAAGVMMAWPLIKKGYRKLRGLPEPEEVEESAETAAPSAEDVSETDENAENAEMGSENFDQNGDSAESAGLNSGENDGSSEE